MCMGMGISDVHLGRPCATIAWVRAMCMCMGISDVHRGRPCATIAWVRAMCMGMGISDVHRGRPCARSEGQEPYSQAHPKKGKLKL